MLLLLLGLSFSILGNLNSSLPNAIAQTSPPPVSMGFSGRVEDASAIVYQQLPYLPKENQYRRLDTGEIDPNHTLISRFIRYHQDLKKRATRYRLDWKITFADYLGVNDLIDPDQYPGKLTLQTNPANTDIKAIQALNRRQRQELVDLLTLIYKPKASANPTPPKASPTPQVTPTFDPRKPALGQPGDAQLLMP
ncbi:MAG: hypothetical protein VKJ02_13555 [Snowella sp.]|nr:hypothetical protein [Snowella sp.]